MPAPQRPPASAELIMIVDDDSVLREFLAVALKEQGYRTVTAGNGMLALSMLERELPSLILTDSCMPGLDGREFAARVRESWGKTVPLVIMSGNGPSTADRNDRTVAAYLPKPFDLDDLFSVVGRFACVPQPAHG